MHDPAQCWVGHRAVVEVSTQRQDDDERTTWLGYCRHQQVNEAPPFFFRRRLCEEFLELVNQQQGFGVWFLRQRSC